MKFTDYPDSFKSAAIGMLEYARTYGMSAEDFNEVWALGICMAAGVHDGHPDKHLWVPGMQRDAAKEAAENRPVLERSVYNLGSSCDQMLREGLSQCPRRAAGACVESRPASSS